MSFETVPAKTAAMLGLIVTHKQQVVVMVSLQPCFQLHFSCSQVREREVSSGAMSAQER
jgi:hypothetical protein